MGALNEGNLIFPQRNQGTLKPSDRPEDKL